MKRAIAIAAITTLTGACLGLTLSATAQNVYKTVDEQGNVAYTDRPAVVERQAELVEGIDIRPTNSSTVATENSQNEMYARASGVATEIKDEQQAREAEEKKLEAAQRTANCEIATTRLKKYSETHRLYRATPDGGREYLTASELDAERTSAALSVEQWCG